MGPQSARRTPRSRSGAGVSPDARRPPLGRGCCRAGWPGTMRAWMPGGRRSCYWELVSRSLACAARPLARSRRLVGRGWPAVTSLATSASRRVEDRAAPRSHSKGRLGVQPLPAHHHPFGLLDQPPVLQGGLELVGQSWPSASTSISPAPSAENSCSAASVICCRVRARPRPGSRLPTAPMLLARSVGSMAWRWRPLWGRPGGPSAAREQAPRMPSGPSGRRMARAGQGLGPEATAVQVVRQRIGNNALNGTPASTLPRTGRPARPAWRSLPVATRLLAASGGTRCGGRVVASRSAQPSLACIDSPRLLPCEGCDRVCS
jgi:hypothetical protein